jgi:hypothetical protein
MTTTERVQAVADYGFTEREARFLVLVMRHAGLCVKRQYAAYTGIANGGDRCNALFDNLARPRFAYLRLKQRTTFRRSWHACAPAPNL